MLFTRFNYVNGMFSTSNGNDFTAQKAKAPAHTGS